MKIAPRQVTVRELVSEYRDDGEGGGVGYDGKLDIRPPFQREFVYKDKQREAVVRAQALGRRVTPEALPNPGLYHARPNHYPRR